MLSDDAESDIPERVSADTIRLLAAISVSPLANLKSGRNISARAEPFSR